MAADETTGQTEYLYSDLTLNAKPSPDGDTLDFFVLLNGVAVPIQRLFVHDYRELFEQAAANAAEPEAEPSE